MIVEYSSAHSLITSQGINSYKFLTFNSNNNVLFFQAQLPGDSFNLDIEFSAVNVLELRENILSKLIAYSDIYGLGANSSSSTDVMQLCNDETSAVNILANTMSSSSSMSIDMPSSSSVSSSTVIDISSSEINLLSTTTISKSRVKNRLNKIKNASASKLMYRKIEQPKEDDKIEMSLDTDQLDSGKRQLRSMSNASRKKKRPSTDIIVPSSVPRSCGTTMIYTKSTINVQLKNVDITRIIEFNLNGTFQNFLDAVSTAFHIDCDCISRIELNRNGRLFRIRSIKQIKNLADKCLLMSLQSSSMLYYPTTNLCLDVNNDMESIVPYFYRHSSSSMTFTDKTFTSFPELPAGLILDSLTGQLSGTISSCINPKNWIIYCDFIDQFSNLRFQCSTNLRIESSYRNVIPRNLRLRNDNENDFDDEPLNLSQYELVSRKMKFYSIRPIEPIMDVAETMFENFTLAKHFASILVGIYVRKFISKEKHFKLHISLNQLYYHAITTVVTCNKRDCGSNTEYLRSELNDIFEDEMKSKMEEANITIDLRGWSTMYSIMAAEMATAASNHIDGRYFPFLVKWSKRKVFLINEMLAEDKQLRPLISWDMVDYVTKSTSHNATPNNFFRLPENVIKQMKLFKSILDDYLINGYEFYDRWHFRLHLIYLLLADVEKDMEGLKDKLSTSDDVDDEKSDCNDVDSKKKKRRIPLDLFSTFELLPISDIQGQHMSFTKESLKQAMTKLNLHTDGNIWTYCFPNVLNVLHGIDQFANHIRTDGVSVSVLVRDLSKPATPKDSWDQKMQKRNNKPPQHTTLTPEQTVVEGDGKQLFTADPGAKVLFTGIEGLTDDPKSIRMTSDEYQTLSKNKYMQPFVLKTLVEEYGVDLKILCDISFSSKTASTEKFLAFFEHNMLTIVQRWSFFKSQKYRNRRFSLYMSRQQALAEIPNRIIYGLDHKENKLKDTMQKTVVVFGHGDCKIGRGYASGPVVKIRQALKQHPQIEYLEVDESFTSQICSACGTKFVDEKTMSEKINITDKSKSRGQYALRLCLNCTGKGRSVKECTNPTEMLPVSDKPKIHNGNRVWGRDDNAPRNIRKVYVARRDDKQRPKELTAAGVRGRGEEKKEDEEEKKEEKKKEELKEEEKPHTRPKRTRKHNNSKKT